MTTVQSSFLERKLNALVDLHAEERGFLKSIFSHKRTVEARTDLWQVGDAFDRAYILEDGWAAASNVMPDGDVQIVAFYLPGDMLGLQANKPRVATYTVSCITRCTLTEVSHNDLDRLHRDHPHLAEALNRVLLRDYAFLVEQVGRLGGRDARERILHGMLELWHRLKFVDIALNHNFVLPITQMDIGSWLNISEVHVSRTMKKLEGEGLIRRDDNRIVLVDVPAIIEIADYHPVYLDDLVLE